MTLLTAALALASALASGSGDVRREVREVEIRGATVYDRDTVLRAIRVRPGEALARDPSLVAATLAARYRRDGYPAARVTATYDEATALLALDVHEGRLAAIAIDGLGGAAAARALRELALPTGVVLEDRMVWNALDRLERAADGAVETAGAEPYSVEWTEAGARLVLHLRKPPVGARPGVGWPRMPGPYNRVDGLNLGAGGEVDLRDARSYGHLRLSARAFYGFSGGYARYALGGVWSFGADQRFALGYEYHDLTDTDDTFRKKGLQEAAGTALNFTSASELHRRLGHEAYAFARLGANVQAGLSFRSDGYTSLPVTTDDSLLFHKGPIPNPSVPEGRMRSLIATVRFAPSAPLYAGGASERASYLQRSLYGDDALVPEGFRAEATLEVAAAGLGSEFGFRRLILRLRGHRQPTPRSVLDTRVLLGLSGGEPPSFKRFVIGGLGTLRGYPNRAFSGARMALVTLEWSFRPGGAWPALIAFYDGGTVWGGSGPRWKSGSGLGVRWPATGGSFLGVDVGLPWNLEPGEASKVRTLVRLQLPF